VGNGDRPLSRRKRSVQVFEATRTSELRFVSASAWATRMVLEIWAGRLSNNRALCPSEINAPIRINKRYGFVQQDVFGVRVGLG